MKEYLDTTWEIWSYDVVGNRTYGYEVNDRSCLSRKYPMRLALVTCNQGTPSAFKHGFPTDQQIKEALDIKPRVHIRTDGDDITIYVEHESTGYPLGELHCISHKSLSPPKGI